MPVISGACSMACGENSLAKVGYYDIVFFLPEQ